MSNDVLNLSVLCVFCTLIPFAILCCVEEFLCTREKRLVYKLSRERLLKK